MKMTVICYKTKAQDTFLSYYTYKTIEEAQKDVRALNENKPEKLYNGERIDWTKIDYFFVSEQESF